MALPQGVRLEQELGSGKVFAVGPGGKWYVPNPKAAAQLFGPNWAQSVEKVRPGANNLPEFGSFDEAMRAAPQAGQQSEPPQTGGQLNFGGAPNVNSGDYGYGQQYQNYLNMAQQTYSNVLSGYQNLLQQQQQQSQGIQQGYGQLAQGVQDQLQGAEAGQQQQLQNLYQHQLGQNTQSAIDRGLGNTTVLDSMQRGATNDQALAQSQLAGQFAQQRAGYQSQLGQAGLGYAGQALGQQVGIYGQQLGWMDSFRQQQPDPLGYASLAQQKQQFQQSNQVAAVPYSRPSGSPSGMGVITDYRPQRV